MRNIKLFSFCILLTLALSVYFQYRSKTNKINESTDFDSKEPAYGTTSKPKEKTEVSLRSKLRLPSEKSSFVKFFYETYSKNQISKVNLIDWKKSFENKKPIWITLPMGKKVEIQVKNLTTDGDTQFYQGTVLEASKMKTNSTTLLISGEYVEGTLKAENQSYRLANGPDGIYIVL